MSVTIDHGKGNSLATLVVIICWKNDDNKCCDYQKSFPLAKAKCTKDCGIILINTFANCINNRAKRIGNNTTINILPNGKMNIVLNGEADDIVDDIINHYNVSTQKFLSGDLLFYATVQGKEGASPHWCCYCDASKTDWQRFKFISEGNPWTIGSLIDHYNDLQVKGQLTEKKYASNRKGIKTLPMFDAFEVDTFVISTLHIEIGLIN